MGFKKTKYILKQAFQGIWRNRMMSVASIGSVAAVLVILGLVLLIVLNISNITLITKEKFDEIFVFLEKDIEDEVISQIGKEIRSLDGVLSVGYETKEYALEKMKEEWGEEGDLLEGIKNNPLPNSYIIQLKSVDNAEEVIEKVKNYTGVEEVRYYKDVIEKLISTSDFMRTAGSIIIIILILISIFIISNTIKITVASRKTEIELMQYVGASNGFVRGPFMIEGLVLGLIGSFIAILIVLNTYNYSAAYINEQFSVLLSVYIVDPSIIVKDIIIIFVTIGVGIGTLGSLVSIKKFLNI